MKLLADSKVLGGAPTLDEATGGERELSPDSVVRKFRITAADGKPTAAGENRLCAVAARECLATYRVF